MKGVRGGVFRIRLSSQQNLQRRWAHPKKNNYTKESLLVQKKKGIQEKNLKLGPSEEKKKLIGKREKTGSDRLLPFKLKSKGGAAERKKKQGASSRRHGDLGGGWRLRYGKRPTVPKRKKEGSNKE